MRTIATVLSLLSLAACTTVVVQPGDPTPSDDAGTTTPPGALVPPDAAVGPDAGEDAATGSLDAGQGDAAQAIDAGPANAVWRDYDNAWPAGDPAVLYPVARAIRNPSAVYVTIVFGPQPPATGKSLVVIYMAQSQTDGGTHWSPLRALLTSHPDCEGRVGYPDDLVGSFALDLAQPQAVDGFFGRVRGAGTASFYGVGAVKMRFDLDPTKGPEPTVCP